MLQDLSDALKTWDTDKKYEKLSSAAQESDILSAIENKLPILKSYIELFMIKLINNAKM